MAMYTPWLDPYASDAFQRARAVLASAALAVAPARRRLENPGGVLPSPLPGLSVVLLNRDAHHYIATLFPQLASLAGEFQEAGLDFQVLVGDTGSRDPDVLMCYEQLPPCFRMIELGPYHFSSNNNVLAYDHAECDVLLFLNNDIELPCPTFLLDLCRYQRDHPRTLLGTQLLYPDGSTQHGGVGFLPHSDGGVFAYHLRHGQPPIWHEEPQPVSALTGAFLMMPKAAFCQAGGFEPGFVDECQDIDLCLKLVRLGYEPLLISSTPVIHHENGSRVKGEANWMDRSLLSRKWELFLSLHEESVP